MTGLLLAFINKAIKKAEFSKHCHIVYCHCGKYLSLLSLWKLLSLLTLRTTNFINMTNSKPTTVIQESVDFHSKQTNLLFLYDKVIIMTAHPLGVFLVFQFWSSTILQDPISDLLRTQSASWFNSQIWLWASKVELPVVLYFRSSTKRLGPSTSFSTTRLGRPVCF